MSEHLTRTTDPEDHQNSGCNRFCNKQILKDVYSLSSSAKILTLSGAIPPHPLYAFMVCTGVTLPFTLFHDLISYTVSVCVYSIIWKVV